MSWLTAVAACVGILGGALGVWVKIRPGARRNMAVGDAILGMEEVRDRSGRTIRPAQAGIVHLQREQSERITNVEQAVVELRRAVDLYTSLDKRLTVVESDVTALKDHRVASIVQSAERAATSAAAVEALRLVNERDTLDADSTEGEPRGPLG